MKFSAVILAAAAGVSANYGYGNTNVTVVTEVVQSYTTYCPEATQITHGTKTYTVTEPTTLTITDCPCTITKPVVPTSVVVCHTCGVFTNSTVATVPVTQGSAAPSSVSAQPPVHTQPGQPPVTGGASKAFAGLAGVVGLAALVL